LDQDCKILNQPFVSDFAKILLIHFDELSFFFQFPCALYEYSCALILAASEVFLFEKKSTLQDLSKINYLYYGLHSGI
jgi:hypothetical protein